MKLRSFISFVMVLLAGCLSAMPAAHADDAQSPQTLRLAIVNTPKMSGLIDALAADFEKQSGIKLAIYSGEDVYERARAGEADIVISHYGKEGVESFVQEGLGDWPQMVFANQLVIAGHKSDPAGIKGMASATAAFAKIAQAKAPFVANDLPGVSYLTQVLRAGAGVETAEDWFFEHQAAKGQAVRLAEERKGYVIWGALPFMRFLSKHPGSEMEVMVSADSLLQRVMAAIVVNPEKIKGANRQAAERFRSYLVSARTQAMIANYRSPGADVQLWWPSARNNAAEGREE